MGCWNATDMITHLPIEEGDPIRMLVLKYASGIPHLGSGFCHADDNWQPIGPAITAVYDDCGRPHEIKNDISAAWLEHILPMNDEVLEEISCHFRFEEMTELEKKILAVERLLSKFDDDHLCLWMVHEETWRTMLSVEFDSYMEDRLDKREDDIKESTPLPDDEPAIRRLKITVVAAKLYNYCRGADKALQWVDPERFDEMVDSIRELSRIKTAMELMRRYFCPMASGGSQHTGFDSHLKLAELTAKMSQTGIEREEE